MFNPPAGHFLDSPRADRIVASLAQRRQVAIHLAGIEIPGNRRRVCKAMGNGRPADGWSWGDPMESARLQATSSGFRLRGGMPVGRTPGKGALASPAIRALVGSPGAECDQPPSLSLAGAIRRSGSPPRRPAQTSTTPGGECPSSRSPRSSSHRAGRLPHGKARFPARAEPPRGRHGVRCVLNSRNSRSWCAGLALRS